MLILDDETTNCVCYVISHTKIMRRIVLHRGSFTWHGALDLYLEKVD